MKAGYKCSKTSDKPKWLTVLCEDLGYGYHLATMNTFPVEDCVIQRVIGGGYDVEIYGPIPNRSNGKYNITLWQDYGQESVENLFDVPFGSVGDRVMELVCTYVPTEVARPFLEDCDARRS